MGVEEIVLEYTCGGQVNLESLSVLFWTLCLLSNLEFYALARLAGHRATGSAWLSPVAAGI